MKAATATTTTVGGDTPKSVAVVFSLLNLLLYLGAIALASSAINHSVQKGRESEAALLFPPHLFPVYFPTGNDATGFFVIFSLLSSTLGFISSASGVHNIINDATVGLQAAASSSFVTWSITLLSTGFAIKEISLGQVDARLRSLEVVVIILSITQLFSVGALHVGLEQDRKRRLG